MTTTALDLALFLPPAASAPASIGDGIFVASINPTVTEWAPPGTGPGGGIPDAPSTGVTFGRNNATWVPVLTATSVVDAGTF
jgi:hypothetical protein